MSFKAFGNQTALSGYIAGTRVVSLSCLNRAMNTSQYNPNALGGAGASGHEGGPVVLIVDDDPMSRELMKDALSPLEFQLITAADGLEGLRVLENIQPDVMLVDIQMPYMDGFEFLTQVRAIPKLAAVPIVAVTAYAMVNDSSRILQHGFDQYLSKPVPVKILRQTVTRLLGGSPSGAYH